MVDSTHLLGNNSGEIWQGILGRTRHELFDGKQLGQTVAYTLGCGNKCWKHQHDKVIMKEYRLQAL